jgi:phage major head subunit gpT-like protein
MLINKASLTGVFTNLKTTFNKAFEGAPSVWDKTAMLVPSTAAQNLYAWLDRFPKMREWIGDKVVKALGAQAYTIINKEWEATVSVLRKDIETDQLGIYGPMAQDAGFSAKQWPDELVAALKNGAFTALCYDGQYFYDTDHLVAGASVSNRSAVALSAATGAAAAASYGAGRTAIMSFKDDEGRPLGLIPNLLEVPPALETVGRILCDADKLGDDTPNPYKGTATLLVNPWLTSTTAWFLHVTNRPIKPFIFQQRKAPAFVQQTNMDSDDVFMRGEYKFGAESSGNGGYGLWQMSYGSTGV